MAVQEVRSPLPDASEASGIVRAGNELLIVSDSDAGAYYRLPLVSGAGPVVKIDPAHLTRVSWSAASLATDLESIDVLADGRIVVLSERLRALVAERAIVIEYDDPLADLGERGLEGVAVLSTADRTSRVATIWEGGYPVTTDLPAQLVPMVAKRALRPVIVVHDLQKGAAGQRHRMDRAPRENIIELQPPLPAGVEPAAQRFRAPDLVWHSPRPTELGFIVLLNSSSAEPERYEHIWLQRFGLAGKAVGEPVDVEKLVPEPLRGMNWEGLAWYEPGRSVILIDDRGGKRRSGPPTAFVVALPHSWFASASF